MSSGGLLLITKIDLARFQGGCLAGQNIFNQTSLGYRVHLILIAKGRKEGVFYRTTIAGSDSLPLLIRNMFINVKY